MNRSEMFRVVATDPEILFVQKFGENCEFKFICREYGDPALYRVWANGMSWLVWIDMNYDRGKWEVVTFVCSPQEGSGANHHR